MDQELVLDDTSIFYDVEMTTTSSEGVWGPIPMHHLNPQDILKNPTVRLASHR